MGKTVRIKVSESIPTLKGLQKKQLNIKSEKRILCLLYLKNNKFRTQQELADYLSIDRRTLSGWINKYKENGIKGILLKRTRNKPSKLISLELHDALAVKVKDSRNPLLGYWDAQRWVIENFNIDIQYHWLRIYLIKHFKTKLKSPRKSHYKKEDKAIDAFLKTT
jgi:transposase